MSDTNWGTPTKFYFGKNTGLALPGVVTITRPTIQINSGDYLSLEDAKKLALFIKTTICNSFVPAKIVKAFMVELVGVSYIYDVYMNYLVDNTTFTLSFNERECDDIYEVHVILKFKPDASILQAIGALIPRGFSFGVFEMNGSYYFSVTKRLPTTEEVATYLKSHV